MKRADWQKYYDQSSALARPKLARMVTGARYQVMEDSDRADAVARIVLGARRKVRAKVRRQLEREG